MSLPCHTSRRLPPVAFRLVLSLVLAATSFGATPAVRAQVPGEQPVELHLENQPVWHDPATDPLAIRLRIANEGIAPLDGFLLTLAAHPVVRTRSGLHESFAGNAGAIASAISKTYPDEVNPGASLEVELEEPVSSLSSLGSVTDGGIYPLTLTLFDASGVVEHDSLTTSLILYPEPPQIPLNLALVVPLNDIPNEGPDAVFRDPHGSDVIPLERAVSRPGWLRGLLRAFEEQAGELPPVERTVRVKPSRQDRRQGRPRFRRIEILQEGLHLGIAPTPRFVQELGDLADGYRKEAAGEIGRVDADDPRARSAAQLLDRLGRFLSEQGVQPLLVPYSFPDLPTLSRYAPDRLGAELDEAAAVMSEDLGVDVSREWFFPPAGRIGAQSLDDLRFREPETARYTIFHYDAFVGDSEAPPIGCPESFASFTCPVSVETSQGPTTGLIADQGLQERLADLVQKVEGRLELQRFFAETAAIRQELPSVEGRVTQVTVPSLWHPPPSLSSALLEGLREAPWIRTVTPAEAVALGEAQPRSDELVQAFPPLRSQPGDQLFDDVRETAELLDDFRRMQPPEQLVARLRRNTLVAQSRLWWPGGELLAVADDYLSATEAEISEEIRKVTIAGPSEINLTSRKGEIPLVISNGTAFGTTVAVEVSSPQPDLVLQPDRLPPQSIAAEDTFQFTVEANARSSGIFPIEVVVSTSDGSLELAYKKITIRSTEFNRIALGITVGAFAFLVSFYLLRLIARRQRKEPTA